MRILILVDCYYPSSKSSAKLIHDLGVELHQQGNEVIVVTPSESKTRDLDVSREEGLLIARIKTGKIKGAPKVYRALQEARLSTTLWRKGKQFFQEHPSDLIIFYSPSIFWAPLVRRLKSLWNCPAYLILRDIFPQWAVDLGVLRKGLIYKFLRMKELEQYDCADIIGVQSPANLEYFTKKLPNKNYHVEVLYNWTKLNEPNKVLSDYRNLLWLQEKVVFFYGGNIGVAQDMDNMLRLAFSLRHESHIFFLLVGEGSEVTHLKIAIKTKGLENTRILPAVAQQEYLAMLSEFDVGLVSLDRRLQTHNFPGKILGYMYSSMPILASLNPDNDLGTMLDKNEAGLCSLNGDDRTLHTHALTLANNSTLRKRMGQNARHLLEQTFSVSSAAKQILAHAQETPTSYVGTAKAKHAGASSL